MEYAQLGTQGTYATNTAIQPKREDAVTSTVERLEHQIMQLAELCQRVDLIADRVDGSGGKVVGNGNSINNQAPAPTRPVYLVGSLGYISGRLGDKLAELQHSLSRIESALG